MMLETMGQTRPTTSVITAKLSTYILPSETDQIPFQEIILLMENLKDDCALIQDINIESNFGQLRRIKITESAPKLKDALCKINLTIFTDKNDKKMFENFMSLLDQTDKEITMSDAIRNLENLCIAFRKISPSTDEIATVRQIAEPLLKTFFNERLEHNEKIVAKIRDMSSKLPANKLGIFLWDDEGHTSTVVSCPPKYYFLDPCGCRQFGRHPVISASKFDCVMETRLQYDGYNCRTMSYIMTENLIGTFKKIGGRQTFNQYFGGPERFGTMKKIRLADGRIISISGEQNPAEFAETHIPPINIPPELITIAQRSVVFRKYQERLNERIKII